MPSVAFCALKLVSSILSAKFVGIILLAGPTEVFAGSTTPPVFEAEIEAVPTVIVCAAKCPDSTYRFANLFVGVPRSIPEYVVTPPTVLLVAVVLGRILPTKLKSLVFTKPVLTLKK